MSRGTKLDIKEANPTILGGFAASDVASRAPVIGLEEDAKDTVVWTRRVYKEALQTVAAAEPKQVDKVNYMNLKMFMQSTLLEIAKASNIEEAIVAISIAFQRELLLTAVNHERNREELREKILRAEYGEYELLAEQIALARAENEQRFLEVRKRLSKKDQKYKQVQVPFREEGSGILRMSRDPKQENKKTFGNNRGRPSSGLDEQKVEKLEEIKSSKKDSGLVEVWSAAALERGTTKGRKVPKDSRSKGARGGAKVSERGCVCKGTGKGYKPNICNPEKDGGFEANTRPKVCQQEVGTPKVYFKRDSRSCRGSQEEQVPGKLRSSSRISTSSSEHGGQKVPWSLVSRGGSSLDGLAVRTEYQPICIHKDNSLVSKSDKEKDRNSHSCICRRSFIGSGNARRVRKRSRKGERTVRVPRRDNLKQDTTKARGGSRIPGFSVEREREGDKSNSGEKEGVQEKSFECIETSSVKESLVETDWENSVYSGGRGPNSEAFEGIDTAGERKERPDRGSWGSERGSIVVEGDSLPPNSVQAEGRPYLRRDNNRCVERWNRCDNRFMGHKWKQGEELSSCNEVQYGKREAYKLQRARSSRESAVKQRKRAKRKDTAVVHRQHHCESDGAETGFPEHWSGPVGFSEASDRLILGKRYKTRAKACARETEPIGRPVIEERRGIYSVAESLSKGNAQAGTLQSGTFCSLWRRETDFRKGRMVGREVSSDSSIGENRSGCELSRTANVESEPTGSTNNMGQDSNNNNTGLEGDTVGAKAREVSTGTHKVRKTSASRSRRMEGEKWTRIWLESILDGFAFKKLADSSKQQYRRRLEKYLEWVWEHKRENNTLAENIKAYLEMLSQTKSGVNVYSYSSILTTLFKEELEAEEREELDKEVQILTREANKKNPVKRHPADAISFSDLLELTERTKQRRLSRKEEIALEIFTLAFCTMSRVGEIARITRNDVLEDGSAIRITPKTEGATANTIVKCVRGWGVIRPENMLRKREEEAGKEGKTFVFTLSKESDSVIRTNVITKALMELALKCGLKGHITAHSARKGAAAEAILAGIPPVVVKAMGYWAQIDTLEKYIGDTVRRQVALLPVLAGGSG